MKFCHVSLKHRFLSRPPCLGLAWLYIMMASDELSHPSLVPDLCVLCASGMRKMGQWVAASQEQRKCIWSPWEQEAWNPVQVDLVHLLSSMCRWGNWGPGGLFLLDVIALHLFLYWCICSLKQWSISCFGKTVEDEMWIFFVALSREQVIYFLTIFFLTN